MTIGVLWEFFECAMDQFFLLDMQKDTVISSISSVLLDPTGRQRPFAIHGITDLIVVAKWIVLVLLIVAALLGMGYGTATVVSNIRNLFL